MGYVLKTYDKTEHIKFDHNFNHKLCKTKTKNKEYISIVNNTEQNKNFAKRLRTFGGPLRWI